MSIYSGFPTREDEKNYNKLVSKLIVTLQSQVLELTGGVIAGPFLAKYQRTISKMQGYEEHKYLPPKPTDLLAPLPDAMNPRRPLHTHPHNDSKLTALAEVKEEEEEPSSSRNLKTAKTEMSIKAKKSMTRYRKVPHKSVITDMGDASAKENKTRSFSLFSSEEKWNLNAHHHLPKDAAETKESLYKGETRLSRF